MFQYMRFKKDIFDNLSSLQIMTNFREIMPDSPETKLGLNTNQSPKVPVMSSLQPVPRPLSTSSSLSGINGGHSPLGNMNGRTPSPPSIGSLMNSSAGQQLPPACGARQLSKLKRFLTTLQQFGSDISPEIGDRVRTLVLGLVNSHLSIEEFHSKLQEATNFPLRPFVIPFLKANLPLLQRELLHCARVAKQTPQQFLTQNEHIVFDPSHSPIGGHETLASELNENGKRRTPDSRSKENGLDLQLEHPAKRHHGNQPISPVSSNRVSPGSNLSLPTGGQISLEDISKSREIRERMEREQLERERERHYSSYSYRSSESLDAIERLDDDWRHVETMLNCIIGMVDKTKRALAVLQERSVRDREELTVWARRHSDGLDSDIKKRSGEMLAAFNLRQTEERVAEVRRRAEEAVNEVKRQAMVELQKAVSAADQKAADLLATERNKMERALAEARKQSHEELFQSLTHQEESPEVRSCWNCGRKASETCSGCNVARYCGSFCQHKDWENHHHVCGKAHVTTVAEARDHRRATTATATTAAPATVSTSSASEEKDGQAPAVNTSTPPAVKVMSAENRCSSESPLPFIVPSPPVKDVNNSSGHTQPLPASPKSQTPEQSSSPTPETETQQTDKSS